MNDRRAGLEMAAGGLGGDELLGDQRIVARQFKLHGQFVPVAARIERIDSMSAHADAGEIMRWLSGFSKPPAMT